MREVKILLNGIDKVKKFVSITSQSDAEMEIICGRYIIDAKSIMGIFSIDLSKPVMLRIHEDKEREEDIIQALKEYIAE